MWKWITLLAAFAICVATLPQANAADTPALEAYRLDNGLEVVLIPDQRVPKAAVAINYRVGTMNEPAGRSGFAHLFEHLMFTGTEAWPYFDAAYGEYGISNNAWTWDDETLYWSEGTSATLPVILSVEADRMANLGSAVSQADLDVQRAVVKNEMRQNVLDSPGMAASEALWAGIYPAPHPYSRATIGSIPDLDAATLDDVKSFFNTFYVPNNAILVIVGDFDPAALRLQIEDTFGRIARGAPLPKIEPTGAVPARARLLLEDVIPTPHVLIGFPGPAASSGQDGALSIANELLGNYEYGVLRLALVNTGLASYATSYWDEGRLGGRFTVEVGAAEGVTAEELETALRDTLAEFAQGTLLPEDVERARQKLLLERRVLLEPFQSRAEDVAVRIGLRGEPELALADNPQLVNATIEDVAAAIRAIIVLEDATTVIVEPGDRGDFPSVLSEPSGEPEPLAGQPRPNTPIPVLTAGEPVSPTLPEMQTGTLANGIAVVHYQTEGAPLVYVAASVTGGARSNPRGQEGLLALAAQMAPNGAGGRDLEAFGKAAKDLGADISTRLDAQRSSIVLSVPPANFGAGVGLLADAVRDPNFDEEAWQVLMAETLDYLGAREGDVADVARRALNEAIFPVGPGEPALESSFESVRAISLEDAKNAFAELFTPQTMTIYSVGDLPLETVLNSLDAQFGDWQSNSPGIEARPDPPAVFPEAQRLILVPDPGTTQAMISVARPTPGFDEPNQAEAVAVMRLLGYDFISRLNAVIREEKGYSYGVDAQAWESLRERAALIVDAPVQSELVGPALKEFFTGFESLASEPIRKDELNRTITAYQLILAGTAETGSGLFDAVLSSAGTGFSLEEVLARQRAMTELELEAVRREAQSLSSLDHAVIVIVGDPDAVLPQLSALGLGEVEVLEREF